MKLHNLIFPILALLVLAAGCTDNPASCDCVEPSTDAFPATLGSSWTYVVHDSLRNTQDTVRVGITGTVEDAEFQTLYVWEYRWSNRVDTEYVAIDQDTVFVFRAVRGRRAEVKAVYEFPLYTGRKWWNRYFNDTTTVSGVSALSTPAGTFARCFVLVRAWGGFNEYGRYTMWFFPKVGMVHMTKREWGFGMKNETWELIDFLIPTVVG